MQPYQPSRREFLKKSTLIAGTAAAVGALSIGRSAHAAGSGEIKIALIGCGGRGTGAAADCLNAQSVLKENIRLVSMADAFEDRVQGALANLKKEFPNQVDVPAERTFVGLDAYQKAIDSGVDVVLLCAPPGFRPVQYAAAIKAGKHVFMEKPCCTDAPGYRSLMETNKLADEKKLKVVVGLQRRHEAVYLHGVQRIHEGELGDIQYMRVFWNGGGGGARDIGKRPQNDPKEMEYQIRNWGCFLWLYGDNIVEQHVHNLDVGNWIMTKDGDVQKAHPVEANGMGGRVNRGNYGDIFDHHTVEFTYADGTKMFSQSRHIEGTWESVGEYVHGAKGNRGVYIGGGPVTECKSPYQQEHVDLIKAIQKGTPLNDGWHGAVSSMTAVFGRMATYSGQVVKWDDAVAKGPDESPERLAWDAAPRHLPGPDGFYPFVVPGVYKAY